MQNTSKSSAIALVIAVIFIISLAPQSLANNTATPVTNLRAIDRQLATTATATTTTKPSTSITTKTTQATTTNQNKTTTKLPYTIKTLSIKKNTKQYTLDIKYPLFQGLKDTKVTTQINSDIKKYVTDQIGIFKSNMAPLADLHGNMNIQKITFETNYISPNLLNIRLDNYTYTAGAHGYNQVTTYLYDLKTGKNITFENLFNPKTTYLDAVSKLAIADLTKRAIGDEDWRKEGAGPKAENFSTFRLSPTDLTIIFQVYQVACYAEGEQKVTIKLSDLKNYLNPKVISVK